MTHSDHFKRVPERALTALTAATALMALALAIALGVGLLAAPAAQAGTYTVPGTCGQWSPYNADGSRIAVYADVPGPDRPQRWCRGQHRRGHRRRMAV